jgi:hypothetical protein
MKNAVKFYSKEIKYSRQTVKIMIVISQLFKLP